MNAKIIKKAMIDKNLNNIELASILKINENTVSRWLNGKNLSNINKFLEMLEILELDINDIKKR